MKEKIQSLIDRHEKIKSKGLQLGEQDLFDRVALREEMADCITEFRSQYQEQKRQNEVEKGKRMIELKSELDNN